MRNLISLTEDVAWEYRADPEGKGLAEKWFEKTLADDVNWKKCYLPQAAGMIDRALFHNYKGEIWFWRRIIISKEMNDRYLELVCPRVWPCCEVFLEGKSLVKQEIPGEPLRVRIPKNVTIENAIPLMIRIFGIETRPETMLSSWFGILEKVSLQSRGHLQCNAHKINIIPVDNYNKAKVEMTFEVATSFDVDVYAQIDIKIWKDAKEVFKKLENFKATKDSINSVTITADIPSPKWWSPDEPQLYDAEIMISRTNQKQDNFFMQFGIRETKTDGKALVLNGKVLPLKGVKYWGTYPNCGPMVPMTLVKEDLRIMKTLGLNCAYMPYPPRDVIMNLADQLGILLLIGSEINNIKTAYLRCSAHPSVGGWITDKAEATESIQKVVGTAPVFGLSVITDQSQVPSLSAGTGPKIISLDLPVRPDRTTHGKPPLEKDTGEYHGQTLGMIATTLQSNLGLAGGVLVGHFADEGTELSLIPIHSGIVTESRAPKSPFWALMYRK